MTLVGRNTRPVGCGHNRMSRHQQIKTAARHSAGVEETHPELAVRGEPPGGDGERDGKLDVTTRAQQFNRDGGKDRPVQSSRPTWHVGSFPGMKS